MQRDWDSFCVFSPLTVTTTSHWGRGAHPKQHESGVILCYAIPLDGGRLKSVSVNIVVFSTRYSTFSVSFFHSVPAGFAWFSLATAHESSTASYALLLYQFSCIMPVKLSSKVKDDDDDDDDDMVDVVTDSATRTESLPTEEPRRWRIVPRWGRRVRRRRWDSPRPSERPQPPGSPRTCRARTRPHNPRRRSTPPGSWWARAPPPRSGSRERRRGRRTGSRRPATWRRPPGASRDRRRPELRHRPGAGRRPSLLLRPTAWSRPPSGRSAVEFCNRKPPSTTRYKQRFIQNLLIRGARQQRQIQGGGRPLLLARIFPKVAFSL